ncbi:MAG: hypothetical protein HW404_2242 [Anaerolineales bacterium]|nr:hypothetical protein [Anaerolineales bacterium]
MQLALWVALILAAPLAARDLRRRLAGRLEPWEAEIAFWSNAVYGVLPLYGAWVTGAVIGRDCGISGFAPANWLSGIVICGIFLVLLAASLRLTSVKRLVRAWTNSAQLIGLGLGAVEWVIRGGRLTRGTPPEVWAGLVRLGVSAGLFALTHNLWLILLTQAAAHALMLRSRRDSSLPA